MQSISPSHCQLRLTHPCLLAQLNSEEEHVLAAEGGRGRGEREREGGGGSEGGREMELVR